MPKTSDDSLFATAGGFGRETVTDITDTYRAIICREDVSFVFIQIFILFHIVYFF